MVYIIQPVPTFGLQIVCMLPSHSSQLHCASGGVSNHHYQVTLSKSNISAPENKFSFRCHRIT